jgi:ribosome recycling factor
METASIFEKMNREMNKSIDHVLHEFSTLHTGKANASMVENIIIDVYGSSMKLRDVAAITTPDARTIQIQPWDKSTAAPIEKSLIDAKLGITPIVTGELIRMPIPELSGERREELCKMAQGFAEQGRIGIRASRKEAMDLLKDAQKNGLPEDDYKRSEKEVQKNTDNAVNRINKALSGKEADLRAV